MISTEAYNNDTEYIILFTFYFLLLNFLLRRLVNS